MPICVHTDLNWIKENADQNSVFCAARVLILMVTGLSRRASQICRHSGSRIGPCRMNLDQTGEASDGELARTPGLGTDQIPLQRG